MYRYPSETAARALWAELGLKPLVDYPGSQYRWRSRHLRCGQEVSPTYSQLRRGRKQGFRIYGCTPCATEQRAVGMRYLLDTYLTPAAHDPGWLYSTVQGYGQISIKGKSRRVHNYVCELVYGPMPPGMVARHSCTHNRACFWAEHLTWGTKGQNRRDTVEHARLLLGATGEALTDVADMDPRDWWRIRKLRAHGTTLVGLSEAFEISVDGVRAVLRGEANPWATDRTAQGSDG